MIELRPDRWELHCSHDGPSKFTLSQTKSKKNTTQANLRAAYDVGSETFGTHAAARSARWPDPQDHANLLWQC